MFQNTLLLSYLNLTCYKFEGMPVILSLLPLPRKPNNIPWLSVRVLCLGMGSLKNGYISSFVVFKLTWMHLHKYLCHMFFKQRLLFQIKTFKSPLAHILVLFVELVNLVRIFDISLIPTIIRKTFPCFLNMTSSISLLYLNNPNCKRINQCKDNNPWNDSKFVLGQHEHTISKPQHQILVTPRHLEIYLNLSLALRTKPVVFGKTVAYKEHCYR